MPSMMKTLLTGAVLLTGVLALPTSSAVNLAIRADDSLHYTEVQLSNSKTQYGNIKVSDAVHKAFDAACTDSSGTCDPQSSSLEVETEIFSKSQNTKKAAKLTFWPQSEWHGSMGGHYVEAAANVASSIQQKQRHKWVEPVVCTGTVCPPSDEEDDFFWGPTVVTIVRRSKEDDGVVDQFIFSVKMELETTEAEVWCTLGTAAGAIAGAFSGPLAAVFGLATLEC